MTRKGENNNLELSENGSKILNSLKRMVKDKKKGKEVPELALKNEYGRIYPIINEKIFFLKS
ncbi:MAG: hypothetical protein ACTSSK_10400 [Candidatus Heimdallarchaeota archaeon]